MDGVRVRTLNYFRVLWFPSAQGESLASLEELLRKALTLKPVIASNKKVESNGAVTEIRHYNSVKEAVFLHVTTYTPGTETTTVPHATSLAQADLDTMEAPSGQEFMDGDVMLRCAGNDVITCFNGMARSALESYLAWLIADPNTSVGAVFRLMPVANVDSAKLLAEQGVKAILLNASLYKVTVDTLEHDSVTKTISGRLKQLFTDLVEADPTFDDLKEAENLKMQLKISFDRRKKGAIVTGQELLDVAKKLTEEHDDEYVIETMSGNKVSSKAITLRKTVELTSFGKTVIYNDAWREMDVYYDELSYHVQH